MAIRLNRWSDFFSLTLLNNKIELRIARFKKEGISKQKINIEVKNPLIESVFFSTKEEIQNANIIIEYIEVNMEILPKDILNSSAIPNKNEAACNKYSKAKTTTSFRVLLFILVEKLKMLDCVKT